MAVYLSQLQCYGFTLQDQCRLRLGRCAGTPLASDKGNTLRSMET